MSWYLPFSKRVDVLSGRWKQLLCTRPDVVLTFKSHDRTVVPFQEEEEEEKRKTK